MRTRGIGCQDLGRSWPHACRVKRGRTSEGSPGNGSMSLRKVHSSGPLGPTVVLTYTGVGVLQSAVKSGALSFSNEHQTHYVVRVQF